MTDGEGTGSACTRQGRRTEAGRPALTTARAASPSAAAGSSPPNRSQMEADVAAKGHERACMRARRG